MAETTAAWRWSEDGLQLIDSTGRSVLKIRPSDATQDEFDLIAAAPDLLAACKAVVEEDGFRGSALMRKRIDAMRAAIARAEGR